MHSTIFSKLLLIKTYNIYKIQINLDNLEKQLTPRDLSFQSISLALPTSYYYRNTGDDTTVFK